MKVFDGRQFVTLYGTLGRIEMMSKQHPDHDITEDLAGSFTTMVKDVERFCEELGLSTAAIKARNVLKDIEPEMKFGSLANSFDGLAEIIALEMNAHLFMYIEPAKAHYYSAVDLFGRQVSEAFPSAVDDIEEAGKCFALNRGTACVFHLMRVLEVGLYALANAMQIQNIEENWHNAIEQIEKAIRGVLRQTAEQKSDLAFYSEAVTYFFNVKEPWRNRTAHTGHIYTEEKAEQVFNSVRGFMQALSTRLTEKPL